MIGRYHLAVLRWHCEGLEGRRLESFTDGLDDQEDPPCRYLDRMQRMTSLDPETKQKAYEQAKREDAVSRTAAIASSGKAAAAYRKMHAAYCAVPSHQDRSVCKDPEMRREYDARDAVSSLDRKAFRTLSLEAETKQLASRPAPRNGTAPVRERPQVDARPNEAERTAGGAKGTPPQTHRAPQWLAAQLAMHDTGLPARLRC